MNKFDKLFHNAVSELDNHAKQSHRPNGYMSDASMVKNPMKKVPAKSKAERDSINVLNRLRNVIRK